MKLRLCDGERERVVPASIEAVERALAPEVTIREGFEMSLADGERWLAAIAVGGPASNHGGGEFLLSGDEAGGGYGRVTRDQALRRFREFLLRTGPTIERPEAREVPTFQRAYLEEVSGSDIGRQLVEQLDQLEQLLAGVDEQRSHYRYAPGKWTVKEVVGHLTDAERVFSYRLLRIGRADATPLPGFDENAYVPAGRFNSRPLSSLLAEFRSVRLSTIALLEALGRVLPEKQWAWTGEASGEPVSARALSYVIVGHVGHHMKVLQERYGLGAVLDSVP